MKYKINITPPEEILAYLDPFLNIGDVTFDRGNERDDVFTLTFDAEDLWEAREFIETAATDADRSFQRVGGSTSYDRAEPAAAKSRREYDAAVGETFDAFDADPTLSEYVPNGGAGVTLDKPWRSEETGERLTAEEATRVRAYHDPTPDKLWSLAPGEGATLHVGSDRYPYTITRVELFKTGARKGTPGTVWARVDDAQVAPDGAVHFLPRPDRDAVAFIPVKGRTDGAFHRPGDTSVLTVGKRSYYQAPEV